MRVSILALAASLLFSGVCGQSTVTTEDELGQTVVEVLTTDADGDTVAITLTTLTGLVTTATGLPTTTTDLDDVDTSTTATTATTSTTTRQQVEGAPESTTGTPHAPIEFQYTTTIAGVETIIAATFTPTFPTTTPTTATGTGSIMNYDDYTRMFSVTSSLGDTTAGNAASRVSYASLLAVSVAAVVAVLGGLPVLLL